MIKIKVKKIFFTACVFLSVFWAFSAFAVNVGNVENFNVDEKFNLNDNSQISAVLVKTSEELYFYVEKNWWDGQIEQKRNETLISLDNLASEFSSKIYPTLTSVFGSEWKPGVDGDNKITILFHPMKEGAAGYFRSSDEYVKLQLPDSNEREMMYISTANIESNQLKVFVAHEFTHLITFNQKDRLQEIQEEVWLNEGRADYSATILGYNSTYEGSNLQRRVRDFLVSPSDALTEWQDRKYDYAVVNVFINYLVEHYGINVLSDSIKLKSIGIASINEILLKDGVAENFSQIFTNWTIAILINDCSLSIKYCYLNPNLSNLRISPTLNFLPLSGNSSLSVINVTKNWSGNWQKIIGGNGDLTLEFSSLAGLDFKVPYIVIDKNNTYSINFLTLDQNQRGSVSLKEFGTQYNSLIIIPSLQTKMSGSNGAEFTYPYTFTISIVGPVSPDEQALIQKLLAQIESLKKQIANLGVVSSTCTSLNNNLYFGIVNNGEVKCLQEFLKNQGSEIYPEALVTGYFGSLTKSAVLRFQRKYGILQTGFVGVLTRTKINEFI